MSRNLSISLSPLWTKKDVLKKFYTNLIPEVTQSKTSFNFPSLGPKSKRFIPGTYLTYLIGVRVSKKNPVIIESGWIIPNIPLLGHFTLRKSEKV